MNRREAMKAILAIIYALSLYIIHFKYVTLYITIYTTRRSRLAILVIIYTASLYIIDYKLHYPEGQVRKIRLKFQVRINLVFGARRLTF